MQSKKPATRQAQWGRLTAGVPRLLRMPAIRCERCFPEHSKALESQGSLTYLRRQYLCVLRRYAFLNVCSSWLQLAAPMAMAPEFDS